jgi:hypothetical protein
MDRLVGVMDGRIAIGTEARVCGGTLKLKLDTGMRRGSPILTASAIASPNCTS